MFSELTWEKVCDSEALRVIKTALEDAALPAPRQRASVEEISAALQPHYYTMREELHEGTFHGFWFFNQPEFGLS